ncbi:MAG: IS200/IS605 family transposase, partial [Desulfuromonadaceae bacterium]
RRQCFTEPMLLRLEEICREQCANWEIELLEFGAEADHCHLLLAMHPNIMPSKFINSLKTVTSRLLSKEYSEHLKQFYWGKPGIWTRAYCLLTTAGAPLETIKKYIQKQERPQT